MFCFLVQWKWRRHVRDNFDQTLTGERVHVIQEAVDRLWAGHACFLFGSGWRWLQGDQQWAADPGESRDCGRETVVHRRDHSGWAECLAVDGWAGNRHDLGARSLRRSRLERGL